MVGAVEVVVPRLRDAESAQLVLVLAAIGLDAADRIVAPDEEEVGNIAGPQRLKDRREIIILELVAGRAEGRGGLMRKPSPTVGAARLCDDYVSVHKTPCTTHSS